ncbi:MAG TPA: fatty acid cis/trans isomerase [Candidatus Binatia bacterium]|nr:fatty acid cis/trans isomerase [Candidatus Binatia bacterium]
MTHTAPSKRRLTLALAPILFAAACSSPPPLGPPVVLPPMPAASGAPVTYRDVQPIIEQRCVVCHGCYDAPCQLLLSSGEGLERGATKAVVYDGGRIHAAAPTRLFIDAHGPAEWRQRGFFPVTGSGSPSLLYMMLALGRAQPFPAGTRLPDAVGLDINRALSCPTAEEFGTYARAHRLGGMPYGMAPLADAEYGTLVEWIAQGAPPPPAPPPLAKDVTAEVARWERFLNGTTLEQRITGRYLYEHWFVAHLYFADLPSSPFFHVVRSTTPPGTPIDEIASRRPYDAPGVDRFWYRLRPIDETIIHKTHITYALDDAKLRRLTALFVDTNWHATRLPSYAPEQASNPFITFDQIPARSRYQYMLDDAQYFVMTFIRGPVCRGQVAVDVIEDHFFAAFLDPDHDMSVLDPTFLEQAKGLLELPAEHLSSLAPGEFFVQYGIDQRRYLDLREQYYDALDPQHRGPTLDAIWNGDGDNTNAQLTIFRHFDSASVVRGFLGATPKTAWVLDYPLFERIYYDLVAGYDVFGNLAHQAATRLYMDHLRMQAENLFLAFLPADRRDAIRASWYVGATHSLDYLLVDNMHSLSHGTQIPFTSPDVERQFLDMIVARTPAVSGPPDLLNRCGAPPCDRPGASALEQSAERALQPLTGVHGRWVAQLPEVSFLRVRSADGGAAYTLVHNRAHTNVAYMFDESQRLVPADDTLTVARGYVGSYPNFLFDVDVAQIDAFTTALAAVTDASTMEKLVARWGVRRTSPAMWSTIDWMHADFRRQQPIQFGLFDLDRFGNL